MKIPNDINKIFEILKQNNFKGYLVGGCVRDYILNRNINDYDIATNAYPEEIIKIFSPICKVIETGLKHGTVTLVMGIEKIRQYEITTFREDVYNSISDHRHPDDVKFSNDINIDLSRRDFTINAMAYNIDEGLIDPFNGREDLKNNVIRCVGDANQRFEEDGLRILRAIRFAARYNFIIDNSIIESIENQNHLLNHISKERIRDEFSKIITSNNPSKYIRIMQKTGVLKFIIPELEPCVGFEQKNIHHDKNVFEHLLSVVDNSSPKLNIRLAALLHDVGKPQCFTMGDDNQGHFYSHEIISEEMAKDILTTLRFENSTIKSVCLLIHHHMKKYNKITAAKIKKLMNKIGLDNINDLFDLQKADMLGSAPEFCEIELIQNVQEQCIKILNEKQPFSLKDIEINGHDLIGLGYKPGKQIGEVLQEILDLVVENKLENKKELLMDYIIRR